MPNSGFKHENPTGAFERTVVHGCVSIRGTVHLALFIMARRSIGVFRSFQA
jgi:hypothetical protein